MGLRLPRSIRATASEIETRVRNGATLSLLCICGCCGSRKGIIISRLVVRAWVPPIGLRLIGGLAIARCMSLYARLCPRERRLWSWERCALLLFVDLQKVPTSAMGDSEGRTDDHTFTMTCEALFHHAVEYRTRFDKTLVH